MMRHGLNFREKLWNSYIVFSFTPCGGVSQYKNNQRANKRRADSHSGGSTYADNIITAATGGHYCPIAPNLKITKHDERLSGTDWHKGFIRWLCSYIIEAFSSVGVTFRDWLSVKKIVAKMEPNSPQPVSRYMLTLTSLLCLYNTYKADLPCVFKILEMSFDTYYRAWIKLTHKNSILGPCSDFFLFYINFDVFYMPTHLFYTFKLRCHNIFRQFSLLH